MNIQASSIDDYFTKTGEHEPELRQLDALIREAAPHLEPTLASSMNWTMVGYGLVPYKTKSMKEPVDYPLVALAAQKNHLALYVMAVEDGEYVAEKYADKLGKVSVGKSCIRFKNYADLDHATLRLILTQLDTRFASGEKMFGI